MACTTTNTIKFEKFNDFYWDVNWKTSYIGRLVMDDDKQWRFIASGFGIFWLTENETFLLFAKLRSLNNVVSELPPQ